MERPSLGWLTPEACKTMPREKWDRRWDEYLDALILYMKSVDPRLLALYGLIDE